MSAAPRRPRPPANAARPGYKYRPRSLQPHFTGLLSPSRHTSAPPSLPEVPAVQRARLVTVPRPRLAQKVSLRAPLGPGVRSVRPSAPRSPARRGTPRLAPFATRREQSVNRQPPLPTPLSVAPAGARHEPQADPRRADVCHAAGSARHRLCGRERDVRPAPLPPAACVHPSTACPGLEPTPAPLPPSLPSCRSGTEMVPHGRRYGDCVGGAPCPRAPRLAPATRADLALLPLHPPCALQTARC